MAWNKGLIKIVGSIRSEHGQPTLKVLLNDDNEKCTCVSFDLANCIGGDGRDDRSYRGKGYLSSIQGKIHPPTLSILSLCDSTATRSTP